MPVPPRRSRWIALSVLASTRGRPIGLPLLVPFAAALRMPAITRSESRLASCLAMVASAHDCLAGVAGTVSLGRTENDCFLHDLSRQNFAWDINTRVGRKILGFSVWLPLALRLANANATVEIAVDTAKVLDETAFKPPYLGDDPVIAKMMALAPGQRRKGPLVDADLPPQPPNAMKARHRPMQVATRIVETAAGPACEIVEIDMLDPSAA